MPGNPGGPSRVAAKRMAAAPYSDSLRGLPLLSGLGEAPRAAVIREGLHRRIPRAAVLFSEGDPAEGLWALLAGRIKLVRTTPQGRELVLHLVEPGQTFAEATLAGAAVYPATAVALEPCELWFWPRERLLALLAAQPDLALALLGSLSAWTRRILTRLELLTQRRVEERLALYLLARNGARPAVPGVTVDLDIPKHLLAGLLGTGPEVLSRTFRRLEESGILGIRGRTITLLDPSRLEDLSHGRS